MRTGIILLMYIHVYNVGHYKVLGLPINAIHYSYCGGGNSDRVDIVRLCDVPTKLDHPLTL